MQENGPGAQMEDNDGEWGARMIANIAAVDNVRVEQFDINDIYMPAREKGMCTVTMRETGRTRTIMK
jgi:hypothetical protein